MKKSICFAYYADNKFIGWYADSFGSVRSYPKVYNDREKQPAIVQELLSNKINRINKMTFREAIDSGDYTGLKALSLAIFDSEELLRGKEVELRIVECPEYDGPNPDFDQEAFEKAVQEWKVGETEKPKCDNWIYADFTKVREWATNEPTEFIGVLKP